MNDIQNEANARRAVADAIDLRMSYGHEEGLRVATKRFCQAATTADHGRWMQAATMMIELGCSGSTMSKSMAIIREERARIFGSEVDR